MGALLLFLFNAIFTYEDQEVDGTMGRRTKHLFDWMEHVFNVTKRAPHDQRLAQMACKLFNLPETQAYTNAICNHPPLKEAKLSLGLHIY